jgi:hypothetical protein
MPTQAAAEEAICQALYEGLPGKTIVWPNKLIDPVEHPREGDAPWAAFHIMHNGSDQHSLGPSGGRVFTRRGGIILQVFVPAGQRGLEEATAFATSAINVFEGTTIEGVRFYRVGSHTVGLDGSWFQVNVRADFEFDEVK